MNKTKNMSDDALLETLGNRLGRKRLDLNLTQANLADQAGVSKRTVERLEAGASIQSLNLIRILRALELLPGLDLLIPDSTPSPMELLKHKGNQRKRASKVKNRPTDTRWAWEDDA